MKAAEGDEKRSRRWSGARRSPSLRVEILLFLFVIALVGPLVHDNGAQQASRYTFTAAMWEEHTYQLDAYESALGIDRAVRDGHIYSDKAPLQPMLAVPFYAAYKAVGGESTRTLRVSENLGLWWMTLWMSVVPLGLLTVLMHRYVGRYRSGLLAPTLAYVVATMLLPFGTVLFGHMLAALLVFLAFYMASGEQLRPRMALAAGLAAGAAVAVDYTATVGVIILSGFLLWRARHQIGWFVLGGVPFAALLAGYHTIAFGSPYAHPYRYSAFSGVVTEPTAPLGNFSGLHLERLWQVFLAGRGFAVATPLVVLGLYGSYVLIRSKSSGEKTAGWMACLMFAAYFGIVLMWGNPWGGESPGPRYMMPAIPFLVVGVAIAWTRLAFISRAAFGLGVLTMGLATITNPLITREVGGGLRQWIDLAVAGEFVPTLFTMALGPIGWAVHIGLVGWIGMLLLREWRSLVPTSAG